jgi:hypothetical protein
MKFFYLIIIFTLFAFSLEKCIYDKAIPKEFKLGGSYSLYSERTHYEIMKIDESKLKTELSRMNYFHCKVKCDLNDELLCRVECLSFTSRNLLTHYYFIRQSACGQTRTIDLFSIDINYHQCKLVLSDLESYYQLNHKNSRYTLIYNFRLGKFELDDIYYNVKKIIDKVEIKKGINNESYTLEVYDDMLPYKSLTFTFTKEKNSYYCFNALEEIQKDYANQENSDCLDSPSFINTINNNNNIVKNYLSFPNSSTNNNNFIENFSLDFKSLALTHINKNIVSLRSDYESNGSTWFDFSFSSHQCYDNFLTLIESFTCLIYKNNIYFLVFKDGDNIFQYEFNLNESVVTKFDMSHKQIKKFKLWSIFIEEGNHVNIEVLRDTSFERFDLGILLFKGKCFENLIQIQKKCRELLAFRVVDTNEFGIIEQITEEKIQYVYEGKQTELELSDFQVKEVDKGFNYVLYMNGTKITIFLKQDIVEKLALYLSSRNKNIFYFKKIKKKQ